MRILVFSLFFVASCTSNSSPEFSNIATQPIHRIDSTSLIDSLYRDAKIISSVEFDTLNCSQVLLHAPRIIQLKCTGSYNSMEFGYSVELEDSALIYTKETFDPIDDYKYISSHVYFGNTKINITSFKYENDSSQIDPINVWFGQAFGPTARFYSLIDRQVAIIRGFNFFCRGRYCSNYKLIIIQNFLDKNISVQILDFPGDFPYSFNNTFLFTDSTSSSPSLYLVKKGQKGVKVSDFFRYKL